MSLHFLRRVLTAFLSAFITVNLFAATTNDAPRERLLMDFGWKFHIGNEFGAGQFLGKAGSGSGPASKSFSDASWRTVNLPHDWAVEMPIDRRADESHGFRAVGKRFATNSVAWYRREFVLPKSDEGKRLWLEFDGVYRDASVFVNGWFVGHHESGYSSFRYDITDVALPGETNLVTVKVDASLSEGWFYEGAGIYRHVWLEKTAPVAIAPDGIFVSPHFENNQPKGTAIVSIQTEILNSGTNTVKALVTHNLIAPDGNVLTNVMHNELAIALRPISAISIQDGEKKMFQTAMIFPEALNSFNEKESDDSLKFYTSALNITDAKDFTFPTFVAAEPVLWSPENPRLYKLITTVEADGKVVDRKETEFGIRTVAFDKDKGFLLNGKPYVIKGTCNHQDHAGVGAALPDDLQYFRIARLKEMGNNAYRTSHNPPTPELLEACDRLGMLVLDENRILGSDEANMERLGDFVRRDRNHPSVIAWSLANEESTQTTVTAGRVGETMQRLVKQLDLTRPVTYASHAESVKGGINDIIEVRGWNYHLKDIDAYRAAHPDQPEVGTEQASTVATRGIYVTDKERGYVSAYVTNSPGWGDKSEKWWQFFAERPWLSGGFVWTGFDYRGEPTPYGWPCINSHFGIMDTCGFPKDNFYYYQSWWSDKIVLHLLPHWNWPGREGQEIEAWALSNCEEVELFLNGQSLGRQPMKKNSHLEWQVKYAPGTLLAKGYTGGKLVAETKIETTGTPAAIQLTPDATAPHRTNINANGEDVSIITVSVTDAQGRIVPTATNLIQFELTGPGRILGVGNGDPSCHEPDVYLPTAAVRSTEVNEWRWKTVSEVRSNVTEYATDCDDGSWKKCSSTNESGPLDGDVRGIFRTRVNLTDADLASPTAELRFGSIHGHGYIYVNGKKAGDSRDENVPQVFDVKRFLHAGENLVAVGVLNIAGSGGVNKGVTLQLQDAPVLPEWKRSVFSGLAQIIVQGTKQPGEIRLTARAEGLSAATTVISAEVCTPRPAVP